MACMNKETQAEKVQKLIFDVVRVLHDHPSGIKTGSFWGYFEKKIGYLPVPKEFCVHKRSELLLLCKDTYKSHGIGNEAIIKLLPGKFNEVVTVGISQGETDKKHRARNGPLEHQYAVTKASLSTSKVTSKSETVSTKIVSQTYTKSSNVLTSRVIGEDLSSDSEVDSLQLVEENLTDTITTLNIADSKDNMTRRADLSSFYDKFYQRQSVDPYPRGSHPLHREFPSTGPPSCSDQYKHPGWMATPTAVGPSYPPPQHHILTPLPAMLCHGNSPQRHLQPFGSASAVSSGKLETVESMKAFSAISVQREVNDVARLDQSLLHGGSALSTKSAGKVAAGTSSRDHQFKVTDWKPISGSGRSTILNSGAVGVDQGKVVTSYLNPGTHRGASLRDLNNELVMPGLQGFAPEKLGQRKLNYARETINNVAADCIERLGESKEYVSLELIERLLLQQYSVNSLDQLKLRRIDELKCVNDHIRTECKVNLCVQTFVKVRSICTLYELAECMREFAPGRENFEALHLGPLLRLPIVYDYFKVPQHVSEICEITTADIVEYLRVWLTENDLWTSGSAKLEDLLMYIMKKRNVSDPYELGIRITSIPLAIQMLKKCQRERGQQVRVTVSTLSETLNAELTAAFHRFTASILQTDSHTQLCSVRAEYLQMDARQVVSSVVNKLDSLYRSVTAHQLSCDPTGSSFGKRSKAQKTHESIATFLSILNTDVLMSKLFQIAVCYSEEQVHQQLTDFMRVAPKACEVCQTGSRSGRNILPSHDEVQVKTLKYLEQCCQQHMLTLTSLARIEAKLLADFKMKHFADLNCGTFFDFLLSNNAIKQFLEEHAGSMLVSAAHGATLEAGCLIRTDDLSEFIKQCTSLDHSQLQLIENAVCQHYMVKDVKSLGHGSIGKLMKTAEKTNTNRCRNVYYETAIVAKQLSAGAWTRDRAVGVLGHVTKEQALSCLQNCPLLEDLSTWSQWEIVFKPELKDLKDFILKHGGMLCTSLISCHGQQNLSTNILALETCPGKLLKLTGDTSPDQFAAAALNGDVNGTCGHLVSIIATNRGLENTPLTLLGNYFRTALFSIHASHHKNALEDGNVVSDVLTKFVLNCLLKIPLIIGHLVINSVFLDGLNQVVGQQRSKRLLLEQAESCCSPEQRSHLYALGLVLGVREWAESFSGRLLPPARCLSAVPAQSDLINVVDSEDEDDKEEEEEEDESSEFSLTDSESSDDESVTEGERMNEEHGIQSSQSSDKINAEHRIPDECAALPSTGSEAVGAAAVSSEGKTAMNEGTTAMNEGKTAMNEREDQKVSESELGVQSETDMTAEQADMRMNGCQELIEKIRQEEFGCNVNLSDEGKSLVAKHQERLGRSLERLSKDLYSKDTHFVLELIQNADDNDYHETMLQLGADVVPSIEFHVDPNCITVCNNEVGFVEKNIRAVCDVGRTTKGKHKFGYIGQKGIGFKSVFRVTDRPEIHSNGFEICFDVKSDALGYILPHWIGGEQGLGGCSGQEGQQQQAKGWMTRIVLPLKADMRMDVSQSRLALVARFKDIDPSLLLFLHRLRSISIVNNVENYRVSMRRRDFGDVIEISHAAGVDRWLVAKKSLDASKISAQAKSGVEVESTEIALAFPLLARDTSKTQIPPKQPVFAFLPVRSYGFRFILQGDFDVPSSREDVDRDSLWNQWLRSEVHHAFVDSLELFKVHAEFSPIEAVIYFFQFVPLEDEILDFFRPVATNILQLLQARPCLPTQGLAWRLPSQLLYVADALVRDVVPSALLRQCVGLDYMHRGVATALSAQLLRALGVQSLNTQHLLEVGKALVKQLLTATRPQDKLAEIQHLSKWLVCIYRSLDEFGQNSEVFSALRTLPMIPLINGDVVSTASQTVFFPLSTSLKKSQKRHLVELEKDLCTVDPALLGVDSVEHSQICNLLEQLHVKKLTAREVIHHHILPVFKSDDWQSKPRELLVTYVQYVREELDSDPSLLSLADLRACIVLLTNHGPKRPADEPIHFTVSYANPFNLEKELPGYDWQLLDSEYLGRSKPSGEHVRQWRQFFTELGVQDYLAVTSKKITFRPPDLPWPWSEYQPLLPVNMDQCLFNDFECTEFTALVTANKHPASFHSQMTSLFQRLDALWDLDYKKHGISDIVDSRGQFTKLIDTSFGIALKILPWIPTVLIDSTGAVERKLSVGKELFAKTPVTLELLANHVAYVDASVLSKSTFSTHLNIRMSIDTDLVESLLLTWCRRAEGLQSTPTSFITTLEHVASVYRYLWGNLPPIRMQELLEKSPVIFYSSAPYRSQSDQIEGRFLFSHETRWMDQTGLFSKYQNSIQDQDMLDVKVRYLIAPLYEALSLHDLFVNCGRIQLQPSVEDYIDLLIHVCAHSSVSNALADVLRIFSVVGKVLMLNVGNPAEKNKVEQIVRKIASESVIPTKAGHWISPQCKPMIADDKKLETLFKDKAAVFFVDCGEKIGVLEKRKLNKDVPDIDLDALHFFLHEAGVQRFSDCIKISRVTELYRPCPELQLYVRGIVSYVQKCLYSNYQDIYVYLISQNIRERLSAMQFAQVSKLELIYELPCLPDSPSVVVSEKCRLVDTCLYVADDQANCPPEWNRELARFFSCMATGMPRPAAVAASSDACNMELRSLLSDIHNKSQPLDELMEERSYEPLPDTEALWDVPMPLTYLTRSKPKKSDASFVEQELSENSSRSHVMGPDGENRGLKAWPPQSHAVGPMEARAAGSGLQMWPPPAPSQNIERNQLPHNLRPSSFEQMPSSNTRDSDENGSVVESNVGRVQQNSDASRHLESQASKRDESQTPNTGSQASKRSESTAFSKGDKQIENTEKSRPSSITDDTLNVSTRGQVASEEGQSDTALSTTIDSASSNTEDISHSADSAAILMGRSESELLDSTKEMVYERSSVSSEGLHEQPMVFELCSSTNPQESIARSGHKRARVNSGAIQNDSVLPNVKQPLTFYGPPVWLVDTDEAAYHHLGSAENLNLPSNICLDALSDTELIGKWGELLVMNFFEKCRADSSSDIVDVEWSNAVHETGLPYDFVLRRQKDGVVSETFIEVKSTISSSKAFFGISIQQLLFAQEKGVDYHIYRVYSAGNSRDVRLAKIENLSAKLASKNVRLMMFI